MEPQEAEIAREIKTVDGEERIFKTIEVKGRSRDETERRIAVLDEQILKMQNARQMLVDDLDRFSKKSEADITTSDVVADTDVI